MILITLQNMWYSLQNAHYYRVCGKYDLGLEIADASIAGRRPKTAGGCPGLFLGPGFALGLGCLGSLRGCWRVPRPTNLNVVC